MSVADYNTAPDQNTSISGINVAEGCLPSNVNNAIRQLMANCLYVADIRMSLFLGRHAYFIVELSH